MCIICDERGLSSDRLHLDVSLNKHQRHGMWVSRVVIFYPLFRFQCPPPGESSDSVKDTRSVLICVIFCSAGFSLLKWHWEALWPLLIMWGIYFNLGLKPVMFLTKCTFSGTCFLQKFCQPNNIYPFCVQWWATLLFHVTSCNNVSLLFIEQEVRMRGSPLSSVSPQGRGELSSSESNGDSDQGHPRWSLLMLSCECVCGSKGEDE